MDMKAKLLAVIGAELVGRASASGSILPVDEVDTLMVAGIILMVIGALWVVRQAVGFMAVGVTRVRKVMVVETPKNVVLVEPGVEELRDQWGRRWVALRDERRGIEREHYLSSRSERTTEVESRDAAQGQVRR